MGQGMRRLSFNAMEGTAATQTGVGSENTNLGVKHAGSNIITLIKDKTWHLGKQLSGTHPASLLDILMSH